MLFLRFAAIPWHHNLRQKHRWRREVHRNEPVFKIMRRARNNHFDLLLFILFCVDIIARQDAPKVVESTLEGAAGTNTVQRIQHGETVYLLQVPVKDGFYFVGWSSDTFVQSSHTGMMSKAPSSFRV